MKKMLTRRNFVAAACLVGAAASLSGCGQSASQDSAQSESADSSAATTDATETQAVSTGQCVVCFSATGHTWAIAQQVASITGADLIRLEAAETYTEADLNYNDETTRATVEQNEGTARPAIAGTAPDIASYGTIYLGYPIWWGKMPRIMLTLLEGAKLDHQEIIPFCTSGSSDIAGSLDELEAAAAGCTVHHSQRFAADASEQEIETWLGL